MKWIWLGCVSLFTLSAMAQVDVLDEAYMTPRRARQVRQERLKQQKAADEYRRQRFEEQEKVLSQSRQEPPQDELIDWYNRRGDNASTDEMEARLDRLEGQSTKSRRGGKYAKRLRRFYDDDAVVLSRSGRVYHFDDLEYDPWSDSYYGYDYSSNVNINISYGWWGRPYYSRYSSYWRPRYYSSWYYPWYDSYYTGWYDPWFDPWYHPARYYGYGWYYGGYSNPWYYGYYGPSVVHHYYYPRQYSSQGRSTTEYYNRTRSQDYGRALGRSSISESRSGGYGTTSRSSSTSRRSWSGGFDDSSRSETSRRSTYSGSPSSSSRSGGSYSSGSSRSSSSSGSSSRGGGNSSRRSR